MHEAVVENEMTVDDVSAVEPSCGDGGLGSDVGALNDAAAVSAPSKIEAFDGGDMSKPVAISS